MRKREDALVLLDGRGPNELDSDCTGAMGSGDGDGGESPRSNHDSTRAHRSQGGVGGGVGRDGNGSCTQDRSLSKLDNC